MVDMDYQTRRQQAWLEREEKGMMDAACIDKSLQEVCTVFLNV